MKDSKRKKLEKAGWTVGSAADFLGLSAAEEMIVKVRLALASQVKERRTRLKWTQEELAKRIGSSQSRVAKVEVADKSVSLELLVRSLASMGASQDEIGQMIAAKPVAQKRPRKSLGPKTAAGK